VVAELPPDVAVLVAEPGVFAFVPVVAELSPDVVVLVVEPGVAFVVGVAAVSEVSEVSELVVAFVALVSVADVSEPQASVDIAVAFDFLVPVSVVLVGVDSSGRSRFFAFPNIDYYSSSSSSVEVVGEESVHSPNGVRTNYGLCSILSSPDLHQNKNLEHCYNNPSPGCNNVSDTNDLPIDATTNHSRKRGLHQCQEKHRHSSQVSLSPLGDRQIKCVEAEEC